MLEIKETPAERESMKLEAGKVFRDNDGDLFMAIAGDRGLPNSYTFDEEGHPVSLVWLNGPGGVPYMWGGCGDGLQLPPRPYTEVSATLVTGEAS